MHIDKSVELVGKLIFGVEAGPTMLTAVREGQALVDDWACLKNMVQILKTYNEFFIIRELFKGVKFYKSFSLYIYGCFLEEIAPLKMLI